MLKRFLLGALAALAVVSTAFAQSSVLPYYYNAQGVKTPVGTSNPLPVDATVSASIEPFLPSSSGSRGTPLTVTTSDSSGTLPTGAAVVVTNVGSNPMYCNAVDVAATTADQYISASGGWFVFTPKSGVTTLRCIATGGSTTANSVGGSGLPAGTGGGSGGGGGGAVTMASGAVSSGAYSAGSIAAGALVAGAFVDGADLTQGAKADSVCGTATGTCSVVALLKYLNAAVGSAIPAGTNLIGDVNLRQGGTALSTTNGIYSNLLQGNAVISATNGLYNNLLQGNAVISATNGIYANQLQGNAVLSASNPAFHREVDGTRSRILDPCEANVQSYAAISITTATTTRIVTPSASNKTYICSLFLTSAAADNVGIVEGTGGTCGTGTAGVIGGTTAANGPNFAANGGVMLQAGGKTAVAQTAGTNVDLCLITSAATPLAGGIKYVQAP